MYYRITRLHFEEERFEDLLSHADSLRDRVERMSGLRFTDLAKTGEGEGMIIAAFDSKRAYQDVADEAAAILGELSSPISHPFIDRKQAGNVTNLS